MSKREISQGLKGHILNTSGTMVGVCVTVVSLVKILEQQRQVNSSLDEVLAIVAVVFVGAALLSYLAMRAEYRGKPGRADTLEMAADVVFVTGLVAMGISSVLFAFEFI